MDHFIAVILAGVVAGRDDDAASGVEMFYGNTGGWSRRYAYIKRRRARRANTFKNGGCKRRSRRPGVTSDNDPAFPDVSEASEVF